MTTANELLNQVYDTIMGNVGMSRYHTPFPAKKVKNQFIGSNGNVGVEPTIYFEIGKKTFEITLKEIDRKY